MSSDGSARVDLHWARFLGVSRAELAAPDVVVTEHAVLGSYHGIWCFQRGEGCVISAPPAWLERLRDRTAGASAGQAAARVEEALGAEAGLRVGPSYLGWLPPARFVRRRSNAVRRLALAERSALAGMRAAVDPVEWEHSALAPDRETTWAEFAGDEITALGQLRSQGAGVVDPCVFTHPRARGSGCGARMVSAMCEHALLEDALVLYQTALTNVPAVAIARRIGFEQYARLVAIRLARD